MKNGHSSLRVGDMIFSSLSLARLRERVISLLTPNFFLVVLHLIPVVSHLVPVARNLSLIADSLILVAQDFTPIVSKDCMSNCNAFVQDLLRCPLGRLL